MNEFDRIKMKDNETIDEFGGKLTKISSKSSALGISIEEPKLVKKFLSSLPRKKYIHIVASLEQVLDLNNTSYEDIIGRLKAYEERVRENEEPQKDQTKLMYTNNEAPNQEYQRDYNNNRGRGGRSWNNRGRGRGRNMWRDPTNITCYRCDKIGHYATDFPDRLLKLQEAQENTNSETHDTDELMMHEVVYLNEKNCLPDKLRSREHMVLR